MGAPLIPACFFDTMALSSTREEILSLDEYSSFQYMLARPYVAKATVNQITSFVFYNEPRTERKTETEHQVLVQGKIAFINYYGCCLAVLPSHILGMSRWISAEDYQSSGKAVPKKAKLQPGDTLRRFQYSYYCGMLQVETRHEFVGYANNGNGQRFRLIEYMDCPISPWVIVNTVIALAATFLGYCLQVYGCEIYFPLLIVSVMALLHSILILSEVQISW